MLAGSGSWSDVAHLTLISTTILSALLVLVTAGLVVVTWKQVGVSRTMARMEANRDERETTARLIIRRAEHYEVVAMGELKFTAYVFAQWPTTAQAVRVSAHIGDQTIVTAQPVTIPAGTEAEIPLHIRDAGELAFEQTDGTKGDLVTKLWVKAQPTNGPAVEWHWGDGFSTHPATRSTSEPDPA